MDCGGKTEIGPKHLLVLKLIITVKIYLIYITFAFYIYVDTWMHIESERVDL